MLFSKPISQLDCGDFENLVKVASPETKTVDYKRELPGGQQSDKTEFVADVSSFANTAGGYLIYGVDAPQGIPIEAHGFICPDIDGAQRRLDQILQNGARPRIRYSMHEVACGAGRHIVLVSIPRSLSAPHQTAGNGRFYGRNTTGRYDLDVFEIRDAFLQAASFADRAAAFREARLEKLRKNEPRVPLKGGSWRLVVHGIPASSFLQRVRYPVLGLYDEFAKLMPRDLPCDWRRTRNFDGIVMSTAETRYLQWFHDGSFEYVDAELDAPNVFSPCLYERHLLTYLPQILKVAEELEIPTPMFIAVSILGLSSKMPFIRRNASFAVRPTGRTEFILPEISIESYADNLGLALKPSLDLVWNEFNLPGSECIDKNGQLV